MEKIVKEPLNELERLIAARTAMIKHEQEVVQSGKYKEEKLNELERLIDYNIYMIKDAQEMRRAIKDKLNLGDPYIRGRARDVTQKKVRDHEMVILDAAREVRKCGVPVTLLRLPCKPGHGYELRDEIMGFVACDLRKEIQNHVISDQVVREMAELRYERFVAQGRLLKAFDGEWE